MNMWPKTLRVSIIISLLFIASCKNPLSPTGTGNPTSSDEYSNRTNLPQVGIISSSQMFLDQLCSRMSACIESFSTSSCQKELSEGTELVHSLGESTEDFATYADLIQSERIILITVNQQSAHSCNSYVQNTSCIEIQTTYDPQASQPYEGLVKYLRDDSSQCMNYFERE